MPAESAILAEILDAYDNDAQEWSDIYKEGATDLRVLAGDVWGALDPQAAKQRKDAKRPMIAPDELGQYVNQVVNDIRANPRGIKFAPTGNGANDKGAEFYQNKTREIEYRSHATTAYTMAFENAVQRGYGYVRVNARYVKECLYDPSTAADPTLFEQELWIDAIPNPDLVLPDPYAQRPDLSDMKRCFVLEWMPIGDFKRTHPDAEVTSFTPAIIAKSKAKAWFTEDRKQILTAEQWVVEHVKFRTLLLLKPAGRSKANPNGQPIAIWKDEINGKQPTSDQILESRKIPITKIVQRKTNGVEILSTTEWQGKYIPITGCFGKILYVDKGDGARKQILSLTRLAREPFLALAYLWSCELEVVGMTPRFPYFYYEGQLSPKSLEDLAKSLWEPIAGVAVKPNVPGVSPPGEVLPHPQRNPYSGEALQYLELLKESARRAIQAAMGITPLPTPVQRENQKSGKALKQLEASGQKGSYHLVDSYNDMIRQTGVILEDQMDTRYDTMRDVAIRKPDESPEIITINDPNQPESIFTKGDYQVTISAGPSNESQRDAANDLLDGLVSNLQFIAPIVGPDVTKEMLAETIKNKVQGPSGDQLANLISPPKQQGQPTPQQMQQIMGEKQQLQAALKKAETILQGETLKYDAQFKIEEMKADKEADLKLLMQQRDIAAKVEAARIAAGKQAADLEAEAREEAIALGLDHAHEAHQADADRAHDLGMAHMQAGHALELGEAGHQQAIDQQANQAALAPQPEAGA